MTGVQTCALPICHPASHHQPLLAADARLEERPLGCGWFDSSHELERGLSVQEGDDAALSALPLAAWLEWQQPRQQPLRLQQLPPPQQPSPPSQSRRQRRLDSAPATAGPDTPWVLLPI